MTQYGEDREPDSYYICMFMVEREKIVKEAIKKEQAKSGKTREKARHKSISEMVDEFWENR